MARTEVRAMGDLVTPMAIRVAATLRLADHMAAGATGVDDLARRTSAHPDALGRLLGHLATVGVVAPDSPTFDPNRGFPKAAPLLLYDDVGHVCAYAHMMVSDVHRHFEKAKAEGATIVHEVKDQEWGLRQYTARDYEGHVWEFCQFIKDIPPEEWEATTAMTTGTFPGPD